MITLPTSAPSSMEWQTSRFSDDLLHALEASWSAFRFPSPFATPYFLHTIAGHLEKIGHQPILSLGTHQDGRIGAVWPMQIDVRGILRFMQDDGSDHCTPLVRNGITEPQCARGLADLIGKCNCRGVYLQRILPDEFALNSIREALAVIGWPFRAFEATPCPVMRVEPGPDPGSRFKELLLSGNKRLKDYQKKLQKHDGFVFEAREDGQELEQWVDEFCDMHDWRWSATTTPSAYVGTDARTEFLEKLSAWQRDQVLVRFAIRLGHRPTAMVVGLKCIDRLVYHHTAASPAYESLHAGNVLIRLIGLWMAERDFRVLDFGVGDEGYKLRFANADEKLHRIYATPSRYSGVMIRGAIDERIRQSRRLQSAWDKWINRRVRGTLRSGYRKARVRMRIIKNVYVKSSMRQRFGLLRTHMVARREIFYSAFGTGEKPDADVRPLSMQEICAIQDQEIGLLPESRAAYHRQRFDGGIAYGIVEHGHVLQISWLHAANPGDIPPTLNVRSEKIWCISQCLTARAARGRGLYPRVLRAIRALIPENEQALIYTDTWNTPSKRGIMKAGFKPVAVGIRRRGHELRTFEPLS